MQRDLRAIEQSDFEMRASAEFPQASLEMKDDRLNGEEFVGTVYEIPSASDEKDLLMDELHHRVRNNLQIVNALISEQAAKIANTREKQAIGVIQRQIVALGIVHRYLHQPGMPSLFDLSLLVRDLVCEKATRYCEIDFELVLGVNTLLAPSRLASAAALAIDELLSVLAEVSVAKLKDTIRVRLDKRDRLSVLTVAAKGARQSADLSRARRLVEGLGGSLNVVRADGAYEIRFPGS
ncbi:MAG: histidine kinase dimerization/phosphoacceptor domain -containing protein [Hyphomicrobium sp.]